MNSESAVLPELDWEYVLGKYQLDLMSLSMFGVIDWPLYFLPMTIPLSASNWTTMTFLPA